MGSRAILALVLAAGLLGGVPRPGGAAGEGEVCGGPQRVTCDGELWCDPAPGHCGEADAAGRCVKVSPMCTQNWQPVCGCNRNTYGNDCERRSNRMAKKADGAC
jgi:hypothetical protein